jgi:5S rRNA maturation endonuclease (ribonuclease M5)
VERGATILVEGKNDVMALKKLGLEKNVLKISGWGSLLDAVEKLSGSNEVILLPDFDEKGEEILRFYSKHLQSVNIRPDIEFWKKLKSLVKKDVHDIEGFVKLFLRQKEVLQNPRSSSKICL